MRPAAGTGRAALAAGLLLAGCRGAPGLEALRDTGYRSLEQGRPEEALAAAREGARRAGEERAALWIRTFRTLEAEALASQRRNAEALGVLESERLPDVPGDVVGTRALMTRALALCRSPERAAEAPSVFERASRGAAALHDARLVAEVALRRGSCHFLREEWEAAEDEFRASLEAARRAEAGLLQAHAAGSLGLVRVRTGRYDEAADWLRRALQLASGPEAELARIKILINAGWSDSLLGDYASAEAGLRRALELTTARGLTGDSLVALTNLGNTHYKLGDYEGATDDYTRALRLARELGSMDDVGLLLANLAAVALEERRYDAASVHVAEACSIALRLKDEAGTQLCAFTEGEIAAGRGDLAGAQERYRAVLADARTPAELSWEVHAALARVESRSGRAAAADAEFGRAFEVMERVRASLGEVDRRITFSSSLRRFHDDYVDFLVESGRPSQALLVADRSRGRGLAERLASAGLAAAPLDSVDAARAVARRSGAVLLAYWTGARRSFLWTIGADRVELRELPPSAELRRDVETYQAAILRARDPLAEQAALGERLWRTLAPSRPLPAGQRVIVVPDGPLHELNLESLIVPGPSPHYWLEDVSLLEAPSLALLNGPPAPPSPRPAQALIIGDPVPAAAAFPRLDSAGREVAAIAALFEPERRAVYSGPAADVASYRRARPEAFAFIHFASHVVANRERPLESAVVLSPTGDAYKLYAREIAGIPLRAELVTLSACRGAGARSFAGEGLVGLAWAFLGAGAHNVVGGLWDVEDASAARLMEDLYRNLRDGGDSALALRDAKLAMLRSRSALRKPFYWAPFVFYTRAASGTPRAS